MRVIKNKLSEARLNTHQTHLESLPVLGKEGLNELNSYIDKFINQLSGNKELTLMSKIDGAPSVFMWHHIGNGYPDNSIALKSFVNGPSTSMSSDEEIDRKYSDRPDMAEKLKQCLKLSKYIPTGEAWQGDCLFTQNDLKEETINDVTYVTFHPNKIVYAFSEDNPGYNKIKNADFGIAFHTIYTINDGKISQSFDVDNSKIQAPDNFYLLFHEMSTEGREQDFDVDKLTSEYTELKQLENKLVNDSNYEDLVKNKSFIDYWNTFENQEFADKKKVHINSDTVLKDLKEYIIDKKEKEFNKKQSTLKTDQGKEKNKEKYDRDLLELEDLFENNKDTIVNIVKTINKAADIKMELWRSLNKSKDNFSTFYKSKTKGYVPANREGISMSDADGNLVKIVDRSEFSSNNRNPDYMAGFEHESFSVATQGADMGSFKSFTKNINEDSNKVAVVAVGRMNPPTIGHKALVNALSKIGSKYGVKPKLFLTHSSNNVKNPLSYESKLRWAAKAFGDDVEIVNSNARSIIEFLSELYNEGYTKIVYAGDKERIGGVEDVSNNILKYNGNPDRSGKLLYNFDEIVFENTGSREVPYEGAQNASATHVRKLAAEKNFDEFKKYVPFNEGDAKNLFNELRHALKDFTNIVEKYLKPELEAELENELNKIDKRLDVPDLRKGLDDYRINQKDYQGMFVKQGSKDVVSFSPKDVAKFAETELHKDGETIANKIDDISIEDDSGNEFELYKSKSTLTNAKGGVTWNDKVEITYYQECIQLLLLTKYANYKGNCIEWLENSDRKKGTGVFEYIYPFNKTKVKDENLFKQYWAGFVKSYSETFNLCINNSNKFISDINNILGTSGGLIPIHGGIKAPYSDLASEVLAGNDTIDKSDGYVMSKKDKSKISKVLGTMVSLKGNVVDYVKFMESAPIVGVSLKKSSGSISFDYNEQPIKPKDVKKLMFTSSKNGSKIIFNLDGEEVSLDLRSAGDVKKIEFRPKGKAAYGNAVEALKRVLGDRYNKLNAYMKSGDYRNATRYLIALLCDEKSPKENNIYEMSKNGAKEFAEIFNYAAGRPIYNKKGERLTTPYMKVH